MQPDRLPAGAPPRFLAGSPIAEALSRLPSYPPSLLFAAGLNAALWDLLPEDARRALQDKRIAIRVVDLGLAFHFRGTAIGFQPTGKGAEDLVIAAAARDFAQLALRREDPDTLFFARRLVMQGDTELGLMMKNTLDALELTPQDLWVRLAPLPLLRALVRISLRF